jgi:short-subunit dehydrogenase
VQQHFQHNVVCRLKFQDGDEANLKKAILFTGAASGFGKLAALELARRGHSVIAGAQIWPQVSELRDEAKRRGIEIKVEKLDVRSEIDRKHAWTWDVDVLVNNAGVCEGGPISEQPMQLIRDNFETNVFCNLELTRGFVRKMVQKKSGEVIFTSSMGGLATFPLGGTYCATKHAIEAIAEAMKAELAPFGIKVATLNPGAFNTGFNDRGVEATMSWYDPQVNFTPKETFSAMYDMLANQLDPQIMADAIVQIVEAEKHKFRNVVPKATEDWLKQTQKDAWEAMS